MVRGGAMTFRSQVPWIVKGSDQCIPIGDYSKGGSISVSGVAVLPLDNPIVTITSITLPKAWQLTINARHTGGDPNTQEGFVITPATCGALGTQPGVLIHALQSDATKSPFYERTPGTVVDEDKATYFGRYSSSAAECLAAGADRDKCERMSTISLKGAATTFQCLDGECVLSFDSPN